MRLWSQLVQEKFKNYVDDSLNQKTNIWDFYMAYQMSLVGMKEEMKTQTLLNKFWKLYILKQELKDKFEEVIKRRMLDKELLKINKFLNEVKQQFKEEIMEKDFNQKGVIGIASYHYDD